MNRTCVCAGLVATVVAGYSANAQRRPVLETSSAEATRTADVAFARKVTFTVTRLPLRRAIDSLARTARVTIGYDSDILESFRRPVTFQFTAVPLGSVLEQLLDGTSLRGVAVPPTKIALVGQWDADTVSVHREIVRGTVTDAVTGRPLPGAKVSIDDANRGVVTDRNGSFAIPGVAAGDHRLTVRLIGYGKQVRSITAGDPGTAVDIVMRASANTLDQVIVTGTVVATERRAIPNAVTVITAQDIERRGIARIDQIFHGDVPGVIALDGGSFSLLDEVTMFSRGATALTPFSAGIGATGNSNVMKTYVDGVEMADPKYFSQIDPRSIERIEILTGPQASTIYGSNAINGVMQIFTKRGTTNRPQLTLNLMSGWVENNFSSARTPQHDYSAQLNGIEGNLSYNAGGAWNYVGPWTPAKQLTRTNGFTGIRLDLPTRAGRVTGDVTFRRSLSQSLQRGSQTQTQTAYEETGRYDQSFGGTGLISPTTRVLTDQTVGLAISYAPASWWSHEFHLGQDDSNTEQRTTAPGYAGPWDTYLRLSQSHVDRRSIGYATTVRVPVTSLAQLTVTAGADNWQKLSSSVDVMPNTLTGTLTGVLGVTRQPDHNTGWFLQSQVGVKDRLYLTYGLRAEWNPNYGADAQPNYAPRYGIAYTQELGEVTAKVRGSYGRSTRPPNSGFADAVTLADLVGPFWSFLSPRILPYYGTLYYSLANPDLGPEYQRGGEGGVELYLGNRGSLVITRYNQTVDDLIAQPVVDSARTVLPCEALSPSCFFHSLDADGYGYFRQSEYINVGSIRNQGWELQGKLNAGPFTTQGTYSWTKSRVIGVNPKYRTSFANQPQYQPGATFYYLPEHTWAVNVTYAAASSSLGINVNGRGLSPIDNASDSFYLQNLSGSIRLAQNRLNVNTIGSYMNKVAGYSLSDVIATHRFAQRVEGVLQVQNVANYYAHDIYAGYASLGRQTKAGVRVRM